MLDDLDDLAPPRLVRAQDIDSWFSRVGLRAGTAGPTQPELTQNDAAQTRVPRARRLPVPPRASRRAGVRARSAVAVLVLVAGVWAATGFYKVQPDQVGVVLRFGQWIDTRGPGLNYHLPNPVETVLLPRVTEVNQLKISNGAVSQMLTGDENIVEATAAIFWRVRDPAKFLFRLQDPEGTVRVAGESAVREVIGLNPIQAGLSDQRQRIADQAQALLQQLLDSYDAGIQVTQVQLQRVDPPTAVIDAFNDVQRARADQERARNEAEAYSRDILPRARGDAERIKQEAQAYREQAVNAAHGEADKFNALYDTYKGAREVTARRLYLDTMEDVLKSAGRIVVDSSGRSASPLLPVLPLAEATKPAAVAPAKAAP